MSDVFNISFGGSERMEVALKALIAQGKLIMQDLQELTKDMGELKQFIVTYIGKRDEIDAVKDAKIVELTTQLADLAAQHGADQTEIERLTAGISAAADVADEAKALIAPPAPPVEEPPAPPVEEPPAPPVEEPPVVVPVDPIPGGDNPA